MAVAPRIKTRKRSGRAGFSLIEIMLAMGIVLFACLAILGSVPLGLSTLRNSAQTSVASQIVDHIHGELLQADFTTLTTQNLTSTEYFDYQGNQIINNTSGAIPTYTALITVTPTSTLPGATTPSTNLATVQILIQNPQAKGNPNRDSQAFSLLIANNEPTTEQ